MKASAIASLPALLLLAAVPASTGQTAISTPAASGAPPPSPGAPVAAAIGEETVVAWLASIGGAQRVLGAAGETPAVPLGPAGRGSDGAPAVAAAGDGAVWVVASRNGGAGERLWAQRRAGGAWQQPVAGPSGAGRNHHPALAAIPGSSRLWAVWIGENAGNRSGSALFASLWTGRSWGAPEVLPRTVGTPMAPSITVDAAGAPVVVWAASDGADAEIWLSRRRGGRWSAPLALTDNAVPDITPSVATAAGRLLVAWISYTDSGYLPRARIEDAGGWGPTVALDAAPGSRPLAAALDGAPVAFWRRLDEHGGGTIIARRLDGDGFGAPTELGEAGGSPFGAGTAADGRFVLAWSRTDGRLDRLEGRRPPDGDVFEALAAAAGAASATAAPAPRPRVDAPDAGGLPARYSAFGDSITNGVVYDPDRRESQGYRKPLQASLRGFFGRGTVINAGIDGESTADGIGRIDNVIRDQTPDVVLVMEGTNDVFAAIDESVIAFNLQRILERAFEEKPGILALLAQIPPEFNPAAGFETSFNERADTLNALLPPIAAALDVPLVDQNTPLRNGPSLWSNPLHPSVAGYKVMGETWYASIKPILLLASNRGDLDGSGRTDGLDLVRLALAFGAIAGDERYDAIADITGDGIIDGFDLNILVEFFARRHDGS
jgi:acyl-CoA thioesterase-1